MEAGIASGREMPDVPDSAYRLSAGEERKVLRVKRRPCGGLYQDEQERRKGQKSRYDTLYQEWRGPR